MKRIQKTTETNLEDLLKSTLEIELRDLSDTESQIIQGGLIIPWMLNHKTGEVIGLGGR